MRRALFLLLILTATACAGPGRRDGQARSHEELAGQFRSPPSEFSPLTYWFWMNGNVSKPGITADLEAMKAVGLKGALVFSIGQDTPAGDVPFGSATFYEHADFAIREADRLDLELGFHNCDGWSASGGPWITPELSMKFLTASEVRVRGPMRFSEELPPPLSRAGLYEDIATLALPLPYVRADDEEDPAAWKVPRAPDFNRRAFANPLASKLLMPKIASERLTPKDAIVDLTDRLDGSGRLVWNVPAGAWMLIRIGYTTTGRTNRVPTSTGRGYECDKLDPAAVEFHFDQYLGEILTRAVDNGGPSFKIAEIDSFEAGGQNWTDGLIEIFRERNGYDVTPYLPIMFGLYVESVETMQKVYYDWRRTIAELMHRSYFQRFAELSGANDLRFYLEPYGTGTFNDLDAARHADRPMGEFWVDNRPATSAATSAGHIYGKRVISAEAFTQGHRNQEVDAWQAHPALLKSIGDLAWSAGINEFVFHRFVHQSNPHARPGLGMGRWGMHMDRTQTWWESAGRAWVGYLRRGQVMLREGVVAPDLLRFTGDSVPMHVEEAEPTALKSDLCNTDVLKTRTAVRDGRIVLPDGVSYQMLVLSDPQPNAPSTMLPETLRRIHELVEAGATVYGRPPSDSPSLATGDEWTPECDAMVEDLWGPILDGTTDINKFGKGRVAWGMSLRQAIESLGIRPDLRSVSGELGWAWTRRTAPARDIYFLANTGDRSESHLLSFPIESGAPEFWYPETGAIEPVTIWNRLDGETRIPLKLGPSASVFVVFDRTLKPARHLKGAHSLTGPLANVLATATPVRVGLSTTEEGAIEAAFWEADTLGWVDADGRQHEVRVGTVPDPHYLDGPWTVSFSTDLGGPESVELDRLVDWTEHTYDGIRFYSGSATYSQRFELTAPPAEDERIVLDLGTIHDVAEVSLNGSPFVTLWKPPFVLDVTDEMRAGGNELQIRITNTWVNRLIGDERLYPDRYESRVDPTSGTPLTELPGWYRRGERPPADGPVTFTTPRFHAPEDELRPAGLIGPVKIRFVPVRQL